MTTNENDPGEPEGIPAGAEPLDLMTAWTQLAGQVQGLRASLTVSQEQTDRIDRQARSGRLRTWLLAAVVLVLLVLSVQVYRTAEANNDNAVTNCQNANESRASTLLLWNFFIDASEANPSNQAPDQQVAVERIRSWIAQLYAPRDCSQLDKQYKVPPPPPIVTPKA